MRVVLFAVALLSAAGAVQAVNYTPTAHGFASFDTDVAICSKNEPGRRSEFQRRLDPVRACGKVDTKLAAEIRASAAYRQDFHRQMKAFADEGAHSRERINVYCDTALANVEQFCARSMGPPHEHTP
ncbi:hypothetical protein SNE35_05820 [Paucibacter sp. R3-3]|uniref:Secreted protein n=1 Tax=Roseateles agri TaxID=3098619 RepID=A0ABU5DCL4_9BURK|nr:hypothetical protein [Paucibacter sp. R3-3]MDY0744010.1 hypothetical protein [Paucibacter sp. R3-3]